ncbi:MAG: hypothetical protein ACOCZ8_05475 [Bacteroidota bacterium]
MIRAFFIAFSAAVLLVGCNGWDDDLSYYPDLQPRALVLLQDTAVTDSLAYTLAVVNNATETGFRTLGDLEDLTGPSSILAVDGQSFWNLRRGGSLQRFNFPDQLADQSVALGSGSTGALAIGRRWLCVAINKRDDRSVLHIVKRDKLEDNVSLELPDRIFAMLANRDEFYLFGQDTMYVIDENAKTVIGRSGYPQTALRLVGEPSIGRGVSIQAGLQLQDSSYLRVIYSTNGRTFDQRPVATNSDEFVTQTLSPYLESAYETEFLGSVQYLANGDIVLRPANSDTRYTEGVEGEFVGLDFLRSIAYYYTRTDTSGHLLIDDLKTPDGAIADFELPEHHIPLRVLSVGD